MGRRVNRIKAWLIEYAYLVTLGALLAVIAASALYTRQLRQETEVAAAAKAQEVGQVAPLPAPTQTPMPTLAPLKTGRYWPDGDGVWPVGGHVLRAYDDQNAVYWQTLACYKPHAALDIAGEAGETVRCAMEGVAADAQYDALWGWRVSIDQADGRRSVYAGLRGANVRKGDAVQRGQALGTLLDHIPCEAEMGPHLHMELYRGERPQDPEGMLAQR